MLLRIEGERELLEVKFAERHTVADLLLVFGAQVFFGEAGPADFVTGQRVPMKGTVLMARVRVHHPEAAVIVQLPAQRRGVLPLRETQRASVTHGFFDLLEIPPALGTGLRVVLPIQAGVDDGPGRVALVGELREDEGLVAAAFGAGDFPLLHRAGLEFQIEIAAQLARLAEVHDLLAPPEELRARAGLLIHARIPLPELLVDDEGDGMALEVAFVRALDHQRHVAEQDLHEPDFEAVAFARLLHAPRGRGTMREELHRPAVRVVLRLFVRREIPVQIPRRGADGVGDGDVAQERFAGLHRGLHRDHAHRVIVDGVERLDEVAGFLDVERSLDAVIRGQGNVFGGPGVDGPAVMRRPGLSEGAGQRLARAWVHDRRGESKRAG